AAAQFEPVDQDLYAQPLVGGDAQIDNLRVSAGVGDEDLVEDAGVGDREELLPLAGGGDTDRSGPVDLELDRHLTDDQGSDEYVDVAPQRARWGVGRHGHVERQLAHGIVDDHIDPTGFE